MRLDPSTLEAFAALILGFVFAGMLASAFELLTNRQASFHLLQGGGVTALACVPVVVFSAPFIILRNTLRGRRFERRPVGFVMAATIIACFWSLMSGRLVLDLAQLIAGA
jgi:predicted signal transduction protein with EAL and GGDEF domain